MMDVSDLSQLPQCRYNDVDDDMYDIYCNGSDDGCDYDDDDDDVCMMPIFMMMIMMGIMIKMMMMMIIIYKEFI